MCLAMVAGQEEYAYVNRVKPGSQYDAGASVASRASRIFGNLIGWTLANATLVMLE